MISRHPTRKLEGEGWCGNFRFASIFTVTRGFSFVFWMLTTEYLLLSTEWHDPKYDLCCGTPTSIQSRVNLYLLTRKVHKFYSFNSILSNRAGGDQTRISRLKKGRLFYGDDVRHQRRLNEETQVAEGKRKPTFGFTFVQCTNHSNRMRSCQECSVVHSADAYPREEWQYQFGLSFFRVFKWRGHFKRTGKVLGYYLND